tara:strand:+ start:560 stop:745 length:186 start_codon:yes stop_codon:yes gene_type:complete
MYVIDTDTILDLPETYQEQAARYEAMGHRLRALRALRRVTTVSEANEIDALVDARAALAAP